jgi:hypothetical protein
MDYRKSINSMSDALADMKRQRLEEATPYQKFSDSKLKQILMDARMQQHSLVRGSIAEMENIKKIESATLILEARLAAVDEDTSTVVKDSTGKVKSWSHETDWKKAKPKTPEQMRGKVTHASDVSLKKTAEMKESSIGSRVSRLVKEAIQRLDSSHADVNTDESKESNEISEVTHVTFHKAFPAVNDRVKSALEVYGADRVKYHGVIGDHHKYTVIGPYGTVDDVKKKLKHITQHGGDGFLKVS